MTAHTPPAALAVREIAGAPAWPELLERLHRVPGFWLLESALPSPGVGRFSFAGARPYLVLRAFGEQVLLAPLRRVRPDLPTARSVHRGDPLEATRALLPSAPAQAESCRVPFVGGAVGWLGYELAARIERVEFPGLDDLGLPDLLWLFVDRVLALELATGRLFSCALGFGPDAARARAQAERGADALAADVAHGRPERLGLEASAREDGALGAVPAAEASGRPATPSSAPLRLRDHETGLELGAFFDEASYAKAVALLKERIFAGDVYQANLTHRLDLAFGGDPWRLQRVLAHQNPAPFAAHLALPELAIVGSSPERFLRVDLERGVESRPMKGTRPRGRTPQEDEALARALAASEKDRAENLMIVDLVRNDLGRVCEVGSVEVPELRVVERYATVFQLVSSVTGRLAAGRDAIDLLRAAFPPGSMTGAPKIAAMKILARLEPVRRGAYSGALGYLDVRGGADLAVVIRTLLVQGGRAHLHVGGGVVADSDPVGEWQESLDKARALLDALARVVSP